MEEGEIDLIFLHYEEPITMNMNLYFSCLLQEFVQYVWLKWPAFLLCLVWFFLKHNMTRFFLLIVMTL